MLQQIGKDQATCWSLNNTKRTEVHRLQDGLADFQDSAFVTHIARTIASSEFHRVQDILLESEVPSMVRSRYDLQNGQDLHPETKEPYVAYLSATFPKPRRFVGSSGRYPLGFKKKHFYGFLDRTSQVTLRNSVRDLFRKVEDFLRGEFDASKDFALIKPCASDASLVYRDMVPEEDRLPIPAGAKLDAHSVYADVTVVYAAVRFLTESEFEQELKRTAPEGATGGSE